MNETMDCMGALDRLTDHLAGELTPDARQSLRRHLEACKKCEAVFRVEGRFDEYIRARLAAESAMGGVMAPEAKAAVFRRLDHVDQDIAGHPPRGMWRMFAVAAILILAVFTAARLADRQRGDDSDMWYLLVNDHQLPLADKPGAVITAEFSVAAPWLVEALGTEAMVPTGAPAGLTLVGVGICECTAGRFVRADFADGSRRLSLYIFPEETYEPDDGVWTNSSAHDYRLWKKQSRRAVCWWGGGMGCILLGDTDHGSLMAIADAM